MTCFPLLMKFRGTLKGGDSDLQNPSLPWIHPLQVVGSIVAYDGTYVAYHSNACISLVCAIWCIKNYMHFMEMGCQKKNLYIKHRPQYQMSMKCPNQVCHSYRPCADDVTFPRKKLDAILVII